MWFYFQFKLYWNLFPVVQNYANSAWVQEMAWCLLGTKPSPDPMLTQMYEAIWCNWVGYNELSKKSYVPVSFYII